MSDPHPGVNTHGERQVQPAEPAAQTSASKSGNQSNDRPSVAADSEGRQDAGQSRKVLAASDDTKWSSRLKAATDVVQALCAIGLLALGVIGYIYTVLPLYSKAVLEEEAAQLKLNNEHLKNDYSDLQKQKAVIDKAVADYRATVIPYVSKQFITKVGLEGQNYKCSPRVFDRGARNVAPPPPITGAKLIEANLRNEELFQLLPDADRASLTDGITDFVAKYSPATDFAAELEIQHAAPFTGPFAAVPKPWPDPFKFCEEELQKSDREFQMFGRAFTALQARLLPDQSKPTGFSPCLGLGLLPKCAAPPGR